MNVNYKNFMGNLGLMLRALSHAHFVSIDLELSGIQSKTFSKEKPPSSGSRSNKQTLQERYIEVKEAAEKFQVLQVGFTFVREDGENGKYVVSPFNMFLSPLIHESLDVERIFAYQSDAVKFLLSHGFRMEGPFVEGVPYLSREEEELAYEIERSREDKGNIAEISIGEDDPEALSFLQRVRTQVLHWKDRKVKIAGDVLNIGSYDLDAPIGIALSRRGLNNFERRLVHQMVRSEFAECSSIGRGSHVEITLLDKTREDALTKSRRAAFKERMSRQVGLRWLVEGMTGGDLSPINPVELISNPTRSAVWLDINGVRRKFDETAGKISKKRTILVGHNIFMDLVYFYKCFFGKLPDRIEEFQQLIHEIFPLVIDTKYLATASNIGLGTKSSLSDLDAELSEISEPVIEMHELHKAYDTAKPAHEAGYDSYVTARVLIRLSTAIAKGSKIRETSKDEDPTTTLPHREQAAVPNDRKVTSVADNDSEATTNSSLEDGEVREGDENLILDWEESTISPNEDNVTTPAIEVAVAEAAKTRVKKVPARMPQFDTPFWETYGNKLRVNGTVEGLCDLQGVIEDAHTLDGQGTQ